MVRPLFFCALNRVLCRSNIRSVVDRLWFHWSGSRFVICCLDPVRLVVKSLNCLEIWVSSGGWWSFIFLSSLFWCLRLRLQPLRLDIKVCATGTCENFSRYYLDLLFGFNPSVEFMWHLMVLSSFILTSVCTSEETCSKVRKGKIGRSASNRTMVRVKASSNTPIRNNYGQGQRRFSAWRIILHGFSCCRILASLYSGSVCIWNYQTQASF